jgi:hypothetical protein
MRLFDWLEQAPRSPFRGLLGASIALDGTTRSSPVRQPNRSRHLGKVRRAKLLYFPTTDVLMQSDAGNRLQSTV